MQSLKDTVGIRVVGVESVIESCTHRFSGIVYCLKCDNPKVLITHIIWNRHWAGLLLAFGKALWESAHVDFTERTRTMARQVSQKLGTYLKT